MSKGLSSCFQMFSLPKMAFDTLTKLAKVGLFVQPPLTSYQKPHYPHKPFFYIYRNWRKNTRDYLQKWIENYFSHRKTWRRLTESRRKMSQHTKKFLNVSMESAEKFEIERDFKLAEVKFCKWKIDAFYRKLGKIPHHWIQTQLIWAVNRIIDQAHWNKTPD